MINRIFHLISEQTSPTEVMTFLFLAIALCLVTSFLIYCSISSIFWSARLRNQVALSRVFLPTRQQFTNYLGEYLIALSTTAILLLTLVIRSELVQQVLSQDVTKLDKDQIRRAFDTHEIPLEAATT